MMKLLPTLALSIAATMTLTGALTTHALAQNAAVVNGKAIPKAKLDKLMASSGQGSNSELRERARDMLIDRELINQEAIKLGLLTNDNIQEQLEQARLNILVNAVLEDYITRDGVSDAELKASYEQIKTQFDGTEYKVRHILVEKEADAKALIVKIKAGEKFEDLAKTSSKDTGSAVNGGDLNWMTPKALVPEFSKAMEALQKGQMTDKPVKSQFGFHVIRVDDVRQAKVPDLAELKPQLIQMMSQDQNWQRTKFDEMLKRLKSKARIQ